MTLSVGKKPLIDLHEDPGHMCDDCGQPDEFCKCGCISTPVLSKPVRERIDLRLGDCLEVMRGMDDKSVDWVITDPPYGIGADKGIGGGSKRGEVKKYEGNWDAKTPDKQYFDEMLRVSKNQIIFGGNYFTDKLYPSSGWIIWDKRGKIMPERTFADGEMAWTSVQKPMRIARFIWDGMIQENMAEKEVRHHPSQKPIALMRWVVEKYTKPGETIFDPFMGSGSTGIACKQTHHSFTGIELDPTYFEIAKKRIQGTQEMML